MASQEAVPKTQLEMEGYMRYMCSQGNVWQFPGVGCPWDWGAHLPAERSSPVSNALESPQLSYPYRMLSPMPP
jgi:hypothetical protein